MADKKTSPKVASRAGTVSNRMKKVPARAVIKAVWWGEGENGTLEEMTVCTAAELESIIASAMAQAGKRK